MKDAGSKPSPGQPIPKDSLETRNLFAAPLVNASARQRSPTAMEGADGKRDSEDVRRIPWNTRWITCAAAHWISLQA